MIHTWNIYFKRCAHFQELDHWTEWKSSWWFDWFVHQRKHDTAYISSSAYDRCFKFTIRISVEKRKGLKAYWTLKGVSNLEFKIQQLHTSRRKPLIKTEYLRNWETKNNCNYSYRSTSLTQDGINLRAHWHEKIVKTIQIICSFFIFFDTWSYYLCILEEVERRVFCLLSSHIFIVPVKSKNFLHEYLFNATILTWEQSKIKMIIKLDLNKIKILLMKEGDLSWAQREGYVYVHPKLYNGKNTLHILEEFKVTDLFGECMIALWHSVSHSGFFLKAV